MAALNFPYSTLKAVSFKLDLGANVISGGVTNGGYQQRVNTSGGGLWFLELSFNRLRTPDQLKAWRVIQYSSDGGVKPVNVPICDLRQAPRPGGPFASGVPHSDGTPFSDDSLYATPWIVAALAADASARAAVISVTFENDSLPLGGEYFSLSYGDGYHELHVIIAVAETEPGVFDLTIRPPLRVAHATGESLEFDHPTGTFVLADVNSMSMATEYGKFGKADASFVEYLGAL